MTNVAFGYGKANDWSKFTSVNLQDVVTANVDGQTGHKILAYSTPTGSYDCSSLTGWGESSQSGCDSLVNPAGQFEQSANTTGNYTGLDSPSLGTKNTTSSFAMKFKLDNPGVSTAKPISGLTIHAFVDESRSHYGNLRSDGTYFAYYTNDGVTGYDTKIATTIPIDTNWHTVSISNANATNGDRIEIDGVVISTTGKTVAGGAAAQQVSLYSRKATGDGNILSHIDFINGWSGTNAIYTQTDATATSLADDALFDAGAGNRWKSLTATVDTSNSTVISYRVRCASTSAGLATATYETVTSGADIVGKERWIQVEVTLQDANSGQYTPVLKDLTLTNEVTPTTMAIGYGKTYDWSKGASVNLQDTNISTATGVDGYKVLAFQSMTTTQEWTSISGWTEYNSAGCDSLINPAGQLEQSSTTAGNYGSLNKNGWANGGSSDQTFSLLWLMKIDAPSISTANDVGGQDVVFNDGSKYHEFNVRSDGTYFDVYNYGTSYAKHDTTIPVDTRFHIWGMQYNNSAGNLNVIGDGAVLYTNGETENGGGGAGTGALTIYVKKLTGDSNILHHFVWHKYINTITPWITTDATWTSTASDSIFNAGLNRQFKKLDWAAVTDNSTGCVVKCRCASTSAGLASATYETLTSGTDIVTKGQWIQIEVTMSDGSNGQYTPILKDLTATMEDAVTYTWIPKIWWWM